MYKHEKWAVNMRDRGHECVNAINNLSQISNQRVGLTFIETNTKNINFPENVIDGSIFGTTA